VDGHLEGKIHPPPVSMSAPLWILAVLSVVGGFIGIPAAFGVTNVFGGFLEPVFERAHELLAGQVDHHPSHAVEFGLMALSLGVVAAGFLIAWRVYGKGMEKPEKMAAARPGLHRLVLGKFFVDEAYDATVVKPLKGTSTFFGRFDLAVIDGLVNLTGGIVSVLGIIVRIFHTGVVRSYAFWIVIGTVAALWLLLG
jgi:NADH-quinone oxidoreductase subunit L